MSSHTSLTPLKVLLFSFYATNTIIVGYLPLYLQYKGLNGTEIGWVLAIGPLASIFSQPFWGYMSDKYKTVKRIIVLCALMLLITGMIFFQMSGLIAILITGAIFFFFISPIEPLSDSIAQRRANEVGVSFGTIRSWGAIGFATSSLLVGELLSHIGIQYMIWPYMFFGLIATVVAFRLKDVKVSSEPIKFKDVSQLVKNMPFMIFLVLIVTLMVTHNTNDNFIGLYIAELGGSERLVGVAWFVGVISEAIVYFLAGFWFRKFHPLIFVIIAGILFTLRWFIYGLVDDPIVIIMLQVLHGLTFGVFFIAAFDYVTRLIPDLLMSTGHLVFFAFMNIAGIIGSLIGGTLFQTFGGQTLYLILGWIALAGTVCITIYHALPYGKETPRGANTSRGVH
ncbi:MFS transporter [Virgibacillus sp. 179-BFC.A HS]|uniref:MFS transporter n=1 Tax=Tigheibacillus jepli TaxID=3035914 RepID=A0ABU5CEW6_9BACI|nr:MFS transporter [Virgibacillus sp. 179-BFC.A HS]MDY0404869.1 MFS transporter [Virgibacillus sp. 179-BFC.A HS]